jgi:hypothetical protein
VTAKVRAIMAIHSRVVPLRKATLTINSRMVPKKRIATLAIHNRVVPLSLRIELHCPFKAGWFLLRE